MENQRIKPRKNLFKNKFSRSFMILLLLMLQFVLLGVSFFLLTQYIHYIYLINLSMSFMLSVYIVNRQESPEFKIAWLTFMCLLPVFGILYYLYIELNPQWKKNASEVKRLIKASANLLEVNEKALNKLAQDLPGQLGLANFLQNQGPYPVYSGSDAVYYNDGEKGFTAIKAALKNARSYIFMEYFIVSPGKLLDELLEILKEKAAAGVEIRFMYDGFCHARTLPDDFPMRLREMGIRVTIFEPLRLFLSTDQNNRDHRKMAIIDGKVAFTGGFNLGDEYVNFIQPFGHWKDAVLQISGDAVKTFVVLFLQNWHLSSNHQEEVWSDYFADGKVKAAENPSCGETGFVTPYADSPNIAKEIGEAVYIDILNQAKDYAWIMSPYLILGSVVSKALAHTAERGVDVRIIIPHIPDKKMPFLIAKSFYPELINAGIRIYEYTPGFIHAKVFVSDDKIAAVGSYNLDFRSFYLNYEVGIWLANCPAIADISADYKNTLLACQEIKLSDYQSQPFSSRIIGRILRIFGPLM